MDGDYDNDNSHNAQTNVVNRVHAWQASHSVDVHNIHYGNDTNLRDGLIDNMLAVFRQVSLQWHRDIVRLPAILEFVSSHVASSHKRFLSRGFVVDSSSIKRVRSGSQLHVRRKLWNWSVIDRAMKQLLGSKVETRSTHQRNGLILIARSRSELIVVMLIGSGKSFFFIVSSQLSGAQISIVIVSLIALKHDLQQRCRELNVSCAVYDSVFSSHQLHALPTLLLVDIGLAVESSFVSFVVKLHASGQLDRLFLDEARLLLTASHYRWHIGVVNQLRRVSCPFVCMTVILSPFVELELKNLMHFTQFETLRASSDRSNLCYCVRSVASADVFREELLLDETTRICMQDTLF